MDLITRTPTLTGVVIGGTMVRPAPCALVLFQNVPDLRTLWICKVTLAPPIDGPIPLLAPTLLRERLVSPAAA